MRSTKVVISAYLRAGYFVFNLSGGIWEHLEGSVWLFRVAELFSYDFPTILHFADADDWILRRVDLRFSSLSDICIQFVIDFGHICIHSI